MADTVPLEVSVAIVGGEGVDDMRAVVVDAAAAVRLCKLSCNTEITNRSVFGTDYKEHMISLKN